jgi:transposase
MTATLDLNTLSEPLRAVFQSVLGERDDAQKLHQESEAEQRRLTIENQLLKETIRLLRLKQYGAKSEQLSDAQLALLDLEPGVTRAEVAAEAALPAREKKIVRVAAPHGRAALPAHLPRVEEIILVPADQRHCATCACPKCALG